ncbi:MAG: hypothetical protein LUG27_06275, partial [Clostridiales bacterium]|nr:hypothetical protein [Clostridiales bacterium]
MKKKWKKIFSLFLALALCASLMPEMALASDAGTTLASEEGDGDSSTDSDGSTDGDESGDTDTDTGSGTALTAEGGTLAEGSYYLAEDITLETDITVASGTTVSIDLNGHTLTGTGTSSVIRVNGTLTLDDSSESGSGTVTGGSTRNGGGVYVAGTFNLDGGCISGNKASYYGGGGVYLYSGTFNMSGGSITDNTAPSGGGVYITFGTSATFNMSGGSITGNTASYYGGGVDVRYSGSFNMSGGTIMGNTAGSYGGGVYLNGGSTDYCTMNMTGGTITGNTAGTGGGGVYVYSGSTTYASKFNVSGLVAVDGNTAGDVEDNAYLDSNSVVTLAGELDEGSMIGVTTATVPTSDSAVQITAAESGTEYYLDAVDCFSSDEDYSIRDNEGGYLELYVGVLPIFTEQPQSAAYLVNAEADALTVEVETEDDASLSYQWYSNTENSTEGAEAIDGAVQASYTPSTAVTGRAYYYCEVTGTDGVHTRSVATDIVRIAVYSDYPVMVSDGTQTAYYLTVAEAFESATDGTYTITLQDDCYADETLTVVSGVEATLDLAGHTLTTEEGVSFYLLTVDGMLTLTDSSEDGSGIITGYWGVYVNGNFYMSGGTISDCHGTNTVYLASGSSFVMNGGAISGNESSRAVYSTEEASVVINAGTISNNAGCGIYMINSTSTGSLVINGGEISGNSSYGVYRNSSSSTFEMNGGKISGNGSGGVRFLSYSGSGSDTFTMNGGEISGNAGCGVYVWRGTFNMTGGIISGNATSTYGGGVCLNPSGNYQTAYFKMSGGEISGNTAGTYGGGVYAYAAASDNGNKYDAS